jgi:hypothetical protein
MGFQDLPDQDESLDERADALCIFFAIDDSGVGDAGSMQLQEVPILSEEDAGFAQTVGELLLVRSTEKSYFG